ncbi:MAG TPA: disulfide bond formation protein B [Allosphingosinicella sp.]|jgi:disulfide bond formation protein DsbB
MQVTRSSLTLAKALALLIPAALLAGAYGSQYLGGLYPCPMCHWQRWPHWVAVALAIGALLLTRMPDRGRSFVWLAALAILVSGGIGVWHAGVEAGVFPSTCVSACSGTGEELMRCLMQPRIACDAIQWKDPVVGISMAGWNAIISILGALMILWLSLKRPRNPALA